MVWSQEGYHEVFKIKYKLWRKLQCQKHTLEITTSKKEAKKRNKQTTKKIK